MTIDEQLKNLADGQAAATKMMLDLFDSLKTEMKQENDSLRAEMNLRFDQVDARLDRMDATLVNHGKQLTSLALSIVGFGEWATKADADYTRVLAELAEVKRRVAKLEERP
jgi:hypothetical protein